MLAFGAEPDRLAVDQRDEHVGPVVLAGDLLEGTVVEHVAVLVDLDEGGPRWAWARRKVSIMCLRSMSWVRATKPASAPRARLSGLKGCSSEPNGVDLVTLATSEVGEYWPLVSP